MNNVVALWWLLLPVLVLPVWWHRQRRHSLKIRTLATAKFLAVTAPQLKPVWRWRDRILLLLRCLILLSMLALLAGWFLSWRGDTVLLSRDLDPQWVQQELQANGMQQARQSYFCDAVDCEIRTDNLLFWLEQQQSQWRPQAKILILAHAEQLAMSGQAPRIAHAVQIRIAPEQASSELKKTSVHVAIQSERLPAWRRLFAAFEVAGKADQTFILSDKIRPDTALAIWDLPTQPDANWRAPLVWSLLEKSAASSQTKTETQAGAQTGAQTGTQIWHIPTQQNNPLEDMHAAKRLFEAWQSVRPQAQQVAMQSQDLVAVKSLAGLSNAGLESAWQQILLACLVLLFVLERGFAHARRA